MFRQYLTKFHQYLDHKDQLLKTSYHGHNDQLLKTLYQDHNDHASKIPHLDDNGHIQNRPCVGHHDHGLKRQCELRSEKHHVKSHVKLKALVILQFDIFVSVQWSKY